MVTGLPLTSVEKSSLHLDVLPKATQKAFAYFSNNQIANIHDWYLAGGTALALQVGHRQSVDLDFFSERQDFDETALEKALLGTGNWKTTLREDGTVYGEYNGAKMSFIAYPFFIPSAAQLQYGNIRILPTHDIAAMKIIAISQRGKKRDFVDLYWLCNNHGSLEAIIQSAIDKYPNNKLSMSHVLKSLVYFADAEDDPMPTIYFPTSWNAIKDFFNKEVPRITSAMMR